MTWVGEKHIGDDVEESDYNGSKRNANWSYSISVGGGDRKKGTVGQRPLHASMYLYSPLFIGNTVKRVTPVNV